MFAKLIYLYLNLWAKWTARLFNGFTWPYLPQPLKEFVTRFSIDAINKYLCRECSHLIGYHGPISGCEMVIGHDRMCQCTWSGQSSQEEE